MTQSDLAEALGISQPMVGRLLKRGMPEDVDGARSWRAQHLNIAQRKRSSPPPPARPAGVAQLPATGNLVSSDESHDQARTRREIAEADIAELKIAELRGDLIRREDMERTVGTLAAGLREAVLQIKARLAPLLAAESDIMKVSAMLDAELRAALDKAAG